MTARIRRSTVKSLAEYQLSSLALLEAAIVFASHTLVVTYPAISRAPRPSDRAELKSARRLLDKCVHLLVTLDAHWKRAAVHLPHGHPAKASDGRPGTS
jgi:hypothetical protein